MASELILKPKLLVNCAVKEFSVIDYILISNCCVLTFLILHYCFYVN